MLKRKT